MSRKFSKKLAFNIKNSEKVSNFSCFCFIHCLNSFCGLQCFRASQFVISKQRRCLEQYSLLFPISFFPQHRAAVPHQLCFMWFLPPYCWQNPTSVYPTACKVNSAAAQTRQSKESRRHIEPIEPDA